MNQERRAERGVGHTDHWDRGREKDTRRQAQRGATLETDQEGGELQNTRRQREEEMR